MSNLSTILRIHELNFLIYSYIDFTAFALSLIGFDGAFKNIVLQEFYISCRIEYLKTMTLCPIEGYIMIVPGNNRPVPP